MDVIDSILRLIFDLNLHGLKDKLIKPKMNHLKQEGMLKRWIKQRKKQHRP